jgi:hypothetical protein
MAPKLTAPQLLERTKQRNIDALNLKELWLESFPPDLFPPPDWELKNAVRYLALEDLEQGIKSYLVKLSKGEVSSPTPKGVLSYICATAHNIKERENPNQEVPPTARRKRNAERNPNSPQWDGDAFGNASPVERQRILAQTIARQKAKGVN